VTLTLTLTLALGVTLTLTLTRFAALLDARNEDGYYAQLRTTPPRQLSAAHSAHGHGRIKVVASEPLPFPLILPLPHHRTPTPTPTPNRTAVLRWLRTADGGCCGLIRWSRG
jgi:hypothetical protein